MELDARLFQGHFSGGRATSFLLLLLLLLLPGCTWGKPLLYDVRWEPHTVITPNADGIDDVTVLHYSLAHDAQVTILFEEVGGEERFVWRDREERAPDDYEAPFGGVVDGRVLPDGQYQVQVIAEPLDGGPAVHTTSALEVQQADSEAPEILGFTVTPSRITPNADGIQDEAVITYSLSKPMDRVEVYLLDEAGARVAVPPDALRDPGEAGSHLHRFDGGVGLGAIPPPDGDYTVVVEAYDKVGASQRVTSTVRLEQSGLPLAQITRHDVEFSTEVLTVGETLFFTTTVTNAGAVPIRTHGPEPGTVYDSTVNYNNFDETISDGAWRLGLDFDGNRVYNGRRYPYRWQLGRTDELTEIDGELYLMPGESVMVTGGLRMLEMPPREAPGFWVGLIHENVRFVEDFVGTRYITVEGEGDEPSTLGTPNGDS